MGQFRVEVVAVGGHGCQREKGDGEKVGHCGQTNCPDCMARDFVQKLKDSGCSVESARLIHWPGLEGQVMDDLKEGVRSGSFRG